ncbi:hypothetical protein D9M69_653970 [compost metagenome]
MVLEVGMPSVSSGASVAVTAELLAASGPATPSIAPTLPNSSLWSDSFFSVAYDRKVGISAPPAGIRPNGKPMKVPRIHAGSERFQSDLFMWTELSLLKVPSGCGKNALNSASPTANRPTATTTMSMPSYSSCTFIE